MDISGVNWWRWLSEWVSEWVSEFNAPPDTEGGDGAELSEMMTMTHCFSVQFWPINCMLNSGRVFRGTVCRCPRR